MVQVLRLSDAYRRESSISRALGRIEKRFYEGYQYDRTHRTWKINGILYEFTISERNMYNERVCKIVMKTGKTRATQLEKVIVDKELTKEEAWRLCFSYVYYALKDGRWFTF